MKPRLISLIFALSTIGFIAVANPAKAILFYNIYKSSGNIVIETDGTLDVLPSSLGNALCGANGAFSPRLGVICTGPGSIFPINRRYPISGPATFLTGSGSFFGASSVSGIATVLVVPTFFFFSIANSYVLGTPIISYSTFNGKTLADLGLTPSSGSLGTWTLDGTTESINVRVVPGPLPLLGAGAAFGFCRRLRRRIQHNKVEVNG
jgi:hypothetical protein